MCRVDDKQDFSNMVDSSPNFFFFDYLEVDLKTLFFFLEALTSWCARLNHQICNQVLTFVVSIIIGIHNIHLLLKLRDYFLSYIGGHEFPLG